MDRYSLLQSYFLDFSYSGTLNLESRFFLYLPVPRQNLKDAPYLDLLSICFEMNSQYKPDSGEILYLVSHATYEGEENLIDKPHKHYMFQFKNEEDIYLNLETSIHKQLERHVNGQIKLVQKKVPKYTLTKPDEVQRILYETQRIERFAHDIKNVIHDIMQGAFYSKERFMVINKVEVREDFDTILRTCHHYALQARLPQKDSITSKHKI